MKGRYAVRIVGMAAGVGICLAVALGAADRPPVERDAPKVQVDRTDRAMSAVEFPFDGTDAAPEAGLAPQCDFVGGFISFLNAGSRYRANVVHVSPGGVAKLREFSMELQFNGTTTLYFTVHLRDVDSNNFVCVRSIEVRNVVGTGVPTFYSTGPIAGGVDLLGNRDYALGVSWGAGVTIRFGWLANGGEEPFGAGEVIGSIGRNGVTPPVCHDLLLPISDDTIYSMEVCVDPEKGACCENGVCDDEKFEHECTAPGGFFHGPRSSCSDTPCRFGVCCLECGGCLDDYTPQACAAEGGVHRQRASCPADPDDAAALCPSSCGACCLPGGCEVLLDTDCLAQGGVYDGDGTSCTPSLCDGACCVSGFFCLDTVHSTCDNFRGRFVGPQTSCATLSPEQECGGGCCFFDDALGLGGCLAGLSRADCSVERDIPNAIYLGDELGCPDGVPEEDVCLTLDHITIHACCLPDGTCINTNVNVCGAVGGAWNPGTDCPLDGSLCAAGPCCLPDGTCRDMTADGCTVFGGCTASDCSNESCNNCPPVPVGTCCGDNRGGPCNEVRRRQCLAEGGHYGGDGTTCQGFTCPGFGACCLPDGSCEDDVTRRTCAIRIGEDPDAGTPSAYAGDGTTCAETECTDERRACCTGSGRCLDLLPEECTALGGTSLELSSCDGQACGACCAADGTCSDAAVHASACADVDDLFTPRAKCEGITCDAVEVCCIHNDACQELRPDDCETEGGFVQGVVTAEFNCQTASVCVPGSCCLGDECQDGDQYEFERSCLDSDPGVALFAPGKRCLLDLPCPRGACCTDGVCTDDVSRVDCLDGGGVFQGSNTACGTEGCGGCCNGSVCRDSTLDACEAEAGEFHAGTVCQTDRPCDPRGACCVDGQCVPDSLQDVCEDSGGAYQGDGSSCAGEVCGGCCNVDGCGVLSCRDVLSGDCTGAEDEFHEGMPCADRPCEPHGACCVEGQCVPDLVADDCQAAPGVYVGDDSICAGRTCELGWCCHVTGECDDLIETECDGPSDTFDAGVDCQSQTCSPRGACCVDGVCSVRSQDQCANNNGVYAGDGLVCKQNSCVEAACCLSEEGGTCEMYGEVACGILRGQYLAGKTCADPDVDCTRGACCELRGAEGGGCTNRTIQGQCPATASFHPDEVCAEIACVARGACCLPGVETCEIMTSSECTDDHGGSYEGDGQRCMDDLCTVGACCFGVDDCEDSTRQRCNTGLYRGAGTSCAADRCCDLNFSNSDPPNCAIDAGMPGDGSRPPWQSFDLFYDCDLTVAPMFTVRVESTCRDPSFAYVARLDGATATVMLSDPIEPGKWTCLVQADTKAEICFGSLPGDANGDGTTNADDLTSVIDHLSGGPALAHYGCDADRSDLCAPPDIIKVIDLINLGWDGSSLPPCPTAPQP